MDTLTLDNVSFGQELESTFDGDDFAMRCKLRNSTRGRSKTVANFDKRIKKSMRATKKIRSQKKAYLRKRR